MKKSLADIAWNVTEEVYRRDHAISYSSLSKYVRDGFDALFGPRIQTLSLTFGSVVDTIITDGWEMFNEKYVVLPLHCSDKLQTILINTAKKTNFTIDDLSVISMETILECANEINYYSTYKPLTVYNKIVTKENCIDFHLIVNQLKNNPTKSIITQQLYEEVQATVKALKQSEATKWYFDTDNDVDRFYQLKFKDTIEGIPYRCMADLIIVDHLNKMIIPCDLKTTGHPEIQFWDSFHTWYYFYQAKLYWNLIRMTMDRDDYFKDFRLLPYRFIVVNKKTLNPMVYIYDKIELEDYTYNNITYVNPIVAGKELHQLLLNRNKEMNNILAAQAIDKMCQGLTELKEALIDIQPNQEVVINPLILATELAKTYHTGKKLTLDKMYDDLANMAQNKPQIPLAWLAEKDGKLANEIKKLPNDLQTECLTNAITKHKQTVTKILKDRYGY